MDWHTIWVALITSGSVNGIAYLLFRVWYEKAVEHKFNEKLSRFKHDLEIAAMERHVRFSKVFDETAKVIATTHKLLSELWTAAQDYAQLIEPPPEEKTEREKVFLRKAQEFSEYYPPNAIYIPKETSEKVRAISNKIISFARTHAISVKMQKAQVRNIEAVESNDKEYLKLVEEIPDGLSELRDEFQNLLGTAKEQRKETN
jgi:hypothetical protein